MLTQTNFIGAFSTPTPSVLMRENDISPNFKPRSTLELKPKHLKKWI